MSSLSFSSTGGYITSWKINNREVLYQGSELKRGGIPFMFPNFDAGDPLPKHGFGRVSKWQILNQSVNSCHLKLTNTDISDEFKKLYPYNFIVELKVETINNLLNYQIFITNLGNINMPISPGLHPYWPVSHTDKNKITLENVSNFDSKNIDWNNSPPDYMVDFNNQLIANFPDYQLTITDFSSDIKFKHLQIWSQNTSFPDYNFVCFEPITLPKNGINTNPIFIKPNQTVNFSLQFKCQFTI
jgi:galactose mutarotase-like enzyme